MPDCYVGGVNTTDPSDYAPLHPGPGLALGLMLLLGLPSAPHEPRPKSPNYRCDTAGIPTPATVVALNETATRDSWEQRAARERRPQFAGTRR